MKLLAVKSAVMKATCVAVAAALAAAPLAASAQASNPAVIPITGTGADGTPFAGTLHIQRFQQVGKGIVALGVLNGTLGSRTVQNEAVAVPVVLPNQGHCNDGEEHGALAPQLDVRPTMASELTQRPFIITTQTCPVLHLTLGPLDLNLLGLLVHLNQVVLNVDAQAGGGLLGNLLCAVANLLNGLNLGALTTALTGIVNSLNGIL